MSEPTLLSVPPVEQRPIAGRQRRRIKPGTKKANLLRTFLARGDLGLNRFEAERLAHDHVLPSSVSGLIRAYGFTFARKDEQVSGFNGSKVETTRYWLTSEDETLAHELLDEEFGEAA